MVSDDLINDEAEDRCDEFRVQSFSGRHFSEMAQLCFFSCVVYRVKPLFGFHEPYLLGNSETTSEQINDLTVNLVNASAQVAQ